MDSTKDASQPLKDIMKEAYEKINLFERISTSQDEMSKNSKYSSMEEYECIYIKDEVYFNLIKEREKYADIRTEILNKISLDDTMTQEEINIKLNYINSELDPRIENLDCKLDDRRQEINLHREEFELKSDKKKTRDKKILWSIVLAGSGVVLVANPKTRKMALKSSKALVVGAVKNSTKLL